MIQSHNGSIKKQYANKNGSRVKRSRPKSIKKQQQQQQKQVDEKVSILELMILMHRKSNGISYLLSMFRKDGLI